ncbi:glycoside hydrolase family 32 protein [Bacillus mangrovi]|uniref:Glycoside hydrolase family 32 protein n=1 Tax=Metabacillus mangrovi TaxID=1491830 RepID=A0A7X2S7D1_9BACI|nr:glycoside hydrolase family 32 protein [Metabacillus mangrovi]MTH54978.1 glycoside hydrolase family 32 protein [Metabacillus mangrovi]
MIKKDQVKYRPVYHFTPEKNWMNDPNGLVYYKGEYHLFFQHHPFGTKWGPMHWGHAVSTDLVHWRELGIALAPDELGAVFSGSAVVDWQDTTGFFTGGEGLVAIFTHADTYPGSDRPRQRQSLAYSTDCGRTWVKYSGNPVLADEQISDFRDPKVFWHSESDRWIMALAAGSEIRFYSSGNLKEWQFESAFAGSDADRCGVWECPDLFPLQDGGEEKWVLIVSIGDSPEYGSRTLYYTGTFNGHRFEPAESARWLDEGRDNYAGVTWSDCTDGRRIYIGWMSNWRYANETPTEGWRSAMTLPRELTLQNGILHQKPVKELANLRGRRQQFRETVLQPESPITLSCGGSAEIIAEFKLLTAREFGFRFRTSKDTETLVGYHVPREELIIDRTASSGAPFHDFYPSIDRVSMPPVQSTVKIHLFLDSCSIEVFGNGGKLAMTHLLFPDGSHYEAELYSVGGEIIVKRLDCFELAASIEM